MAHWQIQIQTYKYKYRYKYKHTNTNTNITTNTSIKESFLYKKKPFVLRSDYDGDETILTINCEVTIRHIIIPSSS